MLSNQGQSHSLRDHLCRRRSGGFISAPRRRYRRTLILTVFWCLAALALAASPHPAHAYTIEKQNDQVIGQFVLSPTKYEITMNPGEKTNREIIVANRTGQTITLEFGTEDFEGSADPSQATVFLGGEASRYSAKDWLKPEVNSIVLQQGETLTMNVEVSVPQGAEPGGHYASLFAATTIESQQQGSAVNITSRLGCLFLITVTGTVREEGSIDIPEVPGFSEYGPIGIGVVFSNTGNIHLKPSGRIIITNFLGQTVAEMPVKEWVVLPDASRRTGVEWDTRYQFGRYTAKAEIDYGSGNVQLVAARSFWIVPWKILAAVIGAVVLIVAVITLILRRRRTKREELEEELERLRTQAATGSAMPGAKKADNVPLNALFPSMQDTRAVNVADPEIQMLVGELVGHQLDLARSYIGQGELEEASALLMEARGAAQRARLYSLVGVIDDLLRGH